MQEESATDRVIILHQEHCKVSMYSGSYVCKENISLVKHSHQVLYSLISQIPINQIQQPTSLCYSESFTSPTQYLFITMSPSTNTRSGLTISTEATTIPTSTSPYMIQTDFATTIANTIKYLLANFDDNYTKQDEKFKETI